MIMEIKTGYQWECLLLKNNPNDIKVNIRDLFEVIPDNVMEEDFLNNDENSSQE